MIGEQIDITFPLSYCHNNGDTVYTKQCGRPYEINQMEKKDFSKLF